MTNLFDVENSPFVEPDWVIKESFVQWRRQLSYNDTLYRVYYEVHDEAHSQFVEYLGTYDSDNDWWLFAVGNGDFDALKLGDNRWDLYAERISDTERVLIGTGVVTVYQSSSDRRTHAEVMVTKIESVLEGRADHDIESYTIKNRSLTRMSVKELTGWRDYYVAEIQRTGGSTTGDNKPSRNTLRVRFI